MFFFTILPKKLLSVPFLLYLKSIKLIFSLVHLGCYNKISYSKWLEKWKFWKVESPRSNVQQTECWGKVHFLTYNGVFLCSCGGSKRMSSFEPPGKGANPLMWFYHHCFTTALYSNFIPWRHEFEHTQTKALE